MTAIPNSGEQYRLKFGSYEAWVASVGATLRSLAESGQDLIAPFGAEEIRPAMRGAVLAPWPNRLADGRYAFDGVEHQLPINEPERGNAAHGLVSWLSFTPIRHSENTLELQATIAPQVGYPWRIRVGVDFELGPAGLRQRITATNYSSSNAPVGLGGHPYVLAASSAVNAIQDWTLELPAGEVVAMSNDRLLPIRSAQVQAHNDGALDFRAPRKINDTVINHAFTSLQRGSDGNCHVRVASADRGVHVVCDRSVDWIQIYTADFAAPGEFRNSLAIEPMSCPPDAFNSGRGLRVLRPGASTHIEWTLGALHLGTER